MAVTIVGSGSITGLSAGGLPDASVVNADLATGVDAGKLINALPSISGASLTGITTGKVLQVVSTDYTGTASSTSATLADVSGFAATITPTSTSNTVLVMVSVCFGFVQTAYPYILVKRNGTSIGTGQQSLSGSQINTFLSGPATNLDIALRHRVHQFSKDYEDSPASTSALTYQIQLASPYASNAGYINRQGMVDTGSYTQFPTSSITLMEIGS